MKYSDKCDRELLQINCLHQATAWVYRLIFYSHGLIDLILSAFFFHFVRFWLVTGKYENAVCRLEVPFTVMWSKNGCWFDWFLQSHVSVNESTSNHTYRTGDRSCNFLKITWVWVWPVAQTCDMKKTGETQSCFISKFGAFPVEIMCTNEAKMLRAARMTINSMDMIAIPSVRQRNSYTGLARFQRYCLILQSKASISYQRQTAGVESCIGWQNIHHLLPPFIRTKGMATRWIRWVVEVWSQEYTLMELLLLAKSPPRLATWEHSSNTLALMILRRHTHLEDIQSLDERWEAA